jgi:L-ascorbate metabolism protein UlaG (beta-lactamase superfamily)
MRVVIGVALLLSTSAQSPGVTVTFLANEGVLLSSGTQKVLIDALFDPYRGYALPHDSTQRALREARAPYDNVDVVLVTHWHGDHFGAAPVAAHLQANPRATLVTSAQVIDSLRRYAPARDIPASRTQARAVGSGERRREVVNGVPVEILGVTHGSGRNESVEHRGYIVEIGGRRVLHLGDTQFTEAEFSRLRLDTARIDVALLPAWALTEERAIVERWIKPRQIVAIHMQANDLAGAARIEAAWPGAVAFTRSLHKRRW